MSFSCKTDNRWHCFQLFSAFLQAEDLNVIIADWSIGAAGNYVVALLNVVKSGN